MEKNQTEIMFDYPPPEETKLLPRGKISSTEVAHVYRLDDGFYREPYDDTVFYGNFCFFDETEQFSGAYSTFEEAVSALKSYCLGLDGTQCSN